MELLNHAAQLIGALVAVAILFFAPKLSNWLTVNGHKVETEELITIILQFVQAAEQLLKDNDPTGEKRKQYVYEKLVALGYEVTEYVASLVEGAVFTVNNAQAPGHNQEVSDR